MRKTERNTLALFSAALLVPLMIASPVRATDVTLDIDTPGTLTISVPATLDLGTAVSPSTINVSMGLATVTDTRNTGTAWFVAVIASALTNVDPPANKIIPTYMEYSSGVITPTGAGSATLVETDQSNLTGSVPVVTASAVTGIQGDTWTPTFTLHIPAAAFNGHYTGTLTQSVA